MCKCDPEGSDHSVDRLGQVHSSAVLSGYFNALETYFYCCNIFEFSCTWELYNCVQCTIITCVEILDYAASGFRTAVQIHGHMNLMNVCDI